MGINFEEMVFKIVSKVNGLPIEDRSLIESFLEHGEWGIALETLCSVIEQESITICQETYDLIKKACEGMEMNADLWVNIYPL